MASKGEKGKIFNDPIHGHIEVSALACKVMDTPQFQRLRDISQLGSVYFVFPGASSKRFEHCVGVSYLAKVFVTNLRQSQPELKITDEEVLCVELAGLCHDLGHGPFSHLYDGKLLPSILHNHDFIHEHASIGLLDLLIEENELLPVFNDHGLGSEDIHFIKELMLGDAKDAPPGFVWKGRPGREFLYDIVANKRNGIDVDKFDYFARDCHMLGLTKSFDSMRLMKFARVFPVRRAERTRGDLEVVFHVKEAWNIFELFHTRYTLHKRAYQHRVCMAVDLMIVQALYLAEPYLTVAGRNGTPRRLSECIHDFVAYSAMSEYLIKVIEFSADPKLAPAKQLIHRLRKRDLFPFCGETILSNAVKAKLVALHASHGGWEKDIVNQLVELIRGHDEQDSKKRKLGSEISASDIFVSIVHVGYGKGTKNPVSQATTAFFEPVKVRDSSGDVQNGVELVDVQGTTWRVGAVAENAVSLILPREFEEVYVRVYGRHKSQAPALKAAFDTWSKNLSTLVDPK